MNLKYPKGTFVRHIGNMIKLLEFQHSTDLKITYQISIKCVLVL